MKNLIQEYKERLEDKLDEHFPKGKTKARGQALVLFAEAMIIIQEVIRAFGSCTKCFGKGYGTQTLNYHESADFEGDRECTVKAPTIVYCSCERGNQLQRLLQNQEETTIE